MKIKYLCIKQQIAHMYTVMIICNENKGDPFHLQQTVEGKTRNVQ